jgi:hypothetical protein
MVKKRPKLSAAGAAKVSGPIQKRPRKLVGLGLHQDDHPLWRLAFVDLAHARWGWDNTSRDELVKILGFLKETERLTWRQIDDLKTGGHGRRGALHKFIPMENLCPDAQDALRDLELDDASDDWYRFRLGGLVRLWGVREGQFFFPVWWDPRHEVCPSADR